MHQLLLLRHAKSSWDDPGLSDHARPLNHRGRVAGAAMGSAMRGLGLAPDLVLVSSARRTLQTQEALEPWDETPLIEPTDALYLADVPQLLGVLRQVRETVRSVLLIGHNPGLHALAIQLAEGQPITTDSARLAQSYPSGALSEFAVGSAWASLDASRARLVRFLCPRDLPDGAG